MSIKMLFSLLSFMILCSIVYAQEAEGPGEIDLDGKQYFGFMRVGEEGPDPKGDFALPVFFNFVHVGDYIYGAFVTAKFMEYSAPPADTSILGFDCVLAYDGALKGTKLSMTLEDVEGPIQYNSKVLKNGDVIKITIPTDKGKYTLPVYLCNSDSTYFSGIYIGNLFTPQSGPVQYKDNLIMGVYVKGSKITICSIFFDIQSDKMQGGVQEGTFDPTTGAFTILGQGAGEPDLSGTIAGNEMSLAVTFPDGAGPASDQAQAETTLYFFGDKAHKKLTATSIKPNKVNSGGEQTVNLNHKYALPGCVVRLVPAGPQPLSSPVTFLKKYEYSSKYLKVTLNPPAGSTGKYKMKITNPDGKEATSKKTLTVK
jgi:hypothetical protein